MNLTLILGLLLALSVAGNALLLDWYTDAKADLAIARDRYTSFVAATKKAGDDQNKEAEKKRLEDEKRKKEADDENSRKHAADALTIAGLRATAAKRNSGGGSVSPAPTGSKCPEGQTCFDRAEYQRAIGDFDSGARRIADEGTAVTADLDTSKKWAKNQ